MTGQDEREVLVATLIGHPWLAVDGFWAMFQGVCPACPGLQIEGGSNSPAHAEHLADAILAAGFHLAPTAISCQWCDAVATGTALSVTDGMRWPSCGHGVDFIATTRNDVAEVKAEALEEAAREVRPKEPTFDISDYSYGAIQVNALHYAADRLESIATHLRETGGA